MYSKLLILQRRPKLGRTKPTTGPHAGRGLDIAALGFCNMYLSSSFAQNYLPSAFSMHFCLCPSLLCVRESVLSHSFMTF